MTLNHLLTYLQSTGGKKIKLKWLVLKINQVYVLCVILNHLKNIPLSISVNACMLMTVNNLETYLKSVESVNKKADMSV